jgi:hypothetical protein
MWFGSFNEPFPKDERALAEKKILDAKLKGDLKAVHGCALASALCQDLGVSVFPDRGSWGTEVKLPERTAGMTVRRLAEVLRRFGIVLVVGETGLRICTYDRPPLPGVKPVRVEGDPGWSIFLLQRRN